MFGKNTFSGGNFAGTQKSQAVLNNITDDIIINGLGFQNSKIITEKLDIYDTGGVEYNAFDIPKRHGTGFISKYWRARNIEVSGIIYLSSNQEKQEKIDEIKKALKNNQIIIKYKRGDNTYRQIKATMTESSFGNEHYQINWTSFSLKFSANEPFWNDTIQENKLLEAVNSNNFSEIVYNGGSEESYTKTFIVFNSASGTNQAKLTIGNFFVEYTGTITAGDMITFDSENQEVLKNNVSVDYTGTFPILDTGNNYLNFEINGTYTADIIINYKKNFN